MPRERDLFDIFPDLPRPGRRVLRLRRQDVHESVGRTRDPAGANLARQKAAAAAVRQRLDARRRRR